MPLTTIPARSCCSCTIDLTSKRFFLKVVRRSPWEIWASLLVLSGVVSCRAPSDCYWAAPFWGRRRPILNCLGFRLWKWLSTFRSVLRPSGELQYSSTLTSSTMSSSYLGGCCCSVTMAFGSADFFLDENLVLGRNGCSVGSGLWQRISFCLDLRLLVFALFFCGPATSRIASRYALICF